METERGRFSLAPSISPGRWFPSDPQLQTHQYRSRLAWRHFKHASARWEPHCGAFLPLCETRAEQSTAGMPTAPSYLRAHRAELPGAAGSLRLQGDAPGSLRCPGLPQGCGEGSAPGCPQRSHPAGMWLPRGKAALPPHTKGLAPPGRDPPWSGGCWSPVRAVGMRWQSELSCPSASLARPGPRGGGQGAGSSGQQLLPTKDTRVGTKPAPRGSD